MIRLSNYALLGFAILWPLGAQDGITRGQADDILSELRQIRQLLEKAPQVGPDGGQREARKSQPTRAQLNLENRPFLGSKDAPLTILEFTDYQCPFCRQFHVSTLNEIRRDYIDTGKVRFYSNDLPLDIHANAVLAAQSARCAEEQGRFWDLRDMMSRNANRLEMPNILFLATDLRMDSSALRSCIESGKYKSAVEIDISDAAKLGVSGTPTFVIGKSTPKGVDGEVVVGAVPYSVFQQKLKNWDRQQYP